MRTTTDTATLCGSGTRPAAAIAAGEDDEEACGDADDAEEGGGGSSGGDAATAAVVAQQAIAGAGDGVGEERSLRTGVPDWSYRRWATVALSIAR